MTKEPTIILQKRLTKRPAGRIDIRSTLKHFALINYAVSAEKIRPHIPDRFEIAEFEIAGQKQALLSVVPFWDADFNFYRMAPWLRWQFGQTNHRVYVIDRESGEHVVWFFGTTLGSRLVHFAQALWKIPWHYSRYHVDCRLGTDGRYEKFAMTVKGDWCSAEIELADTGKPFQVQDGFSSLAEQRLILTHPIDGYYYCSDGVLGGYSIWHEEIPLTMADPIHLYFSLYERLGILTREEMQRPHSIFVCPEIVFDVYLPPKRFSEK